MSGTGRFASPERQVLRDKSVFAPIPGLNPTRACFDLPVSPPDSTASDHPLNPHLAALSTPLTSAELDWRSRDSRKGRHILRIARAPTATTAPLYSTNWRAILRGIWRMCTVFAWWDVSWWIGVLFSVGSAIFVVAGCFYWVPLVSPRTEFPNESLVGGGVTSFIGATLFQIGAVMLMIEAVNEGQTTCFGWALERAVTGGSDEEDAIASKTNGSSSAVHAKPADCIHHHCRGLHRLAELPRPARGRKWEWVPTWTELKTHYLREIGFLASAVLALGSTVFYVSGIMSLPGITNKISVHVAWGTYWLAYLVGGVLFTMSSVLYVLETQKNLYTPAPTVLGWWIGVLNTIGSVGWTLSAAFGYCSAGWCEYQSDLSLLWASIAFLMGSLLLWYESLDKFPVLEKKDG